MTKPTIVRATPILALLAALALLARDAQAQGSPAGTQMTPDSRRYLISKDVGAERWAISFDLETRTVTGNVFKTDGSPPSFIFCQIKSETPAEDPAANAYLLDCYGADACASAPCSDDAWTLIAQDLAIGGDFLLPDGTGSTFRGHVLPIFAQRCAIPTCHMGEAPADGLSLEPAVAYDRIFGVPSAHEAEHFLIDPFDTSSSHLYGKILGIEEEGERMPLGGPYLLDEQANRIRDWILEGAADN
jgi:hypothetical protein